MTRNSCHRIARRIILATRPGPWNCDKCGVLMLRLGTKKGMAHVHHDDGDWTNNDPTNLILRCSSCHPKSHPKPIRSGWHVSEETKAKISANHARTGGPRSEETRNKISESIKKLRDKRRSQIHSSTLDNRLSVL